MQQLKIPFTKSRLVDRIETAAKRAQFRSDQNSDIAPIKLFEAELKSEMTLFVNNLPEYLKMDKVIDFTFLQKVRTDKKVKIINYEIFINITYQYYLSNQIPSADAILMELDCSFYINRQNVMKVSINSYPAQNINEPSECTQNKSFLDNQTFVSQRKNTLTNTGKQIPENKLDWAPFAGTAFSTGSELYYSEKFGTWMGKNFKIYNKTFNGNAFTGGKLNFGKATSNAFKWGGRAVGLWNGYSTFKLYKQEEIGLGWMLTEQSSNLYSTFGGLYGAAWGIGWELGRTISEMTWYKEAKFNLYYNIMQKRFGAPSKLNEDYWQEFYNNYRP